MSLRINLNSAAFNAHRNLQATDSALSKSIERLSSGYRINRGADDPAGLVISENLRAQISGLGQAISNSQDAVNLVKTAEGALTEVNALLRSMRDLAVHAANAGVNGADAIAADQQQVDSAVESLDRISSTTSFGTTKLLGGDGAGGSLSLTFQIGANSGETATVTIAATDSGTLGVDALDLSGDAAGAITALDAAISTVSSMRADLGAFQKNVLESNINSLGVAKENVAASESAIRDTDMAAEMVQFTRYQIMEQAGTAMLTQANQAPQQLLSLLR